MLLVKLRQLTVLPWLSVVIIVVVGVLGPAGGQRRAGRCHALHRLQVALLVGRAVVHGARALALGAAAVHCRGTESTTVRHLTLNNARAWRLTRMTGPETAATGAALV